MTEVREYKPKSSDPPGFAPWTAARCRDALAAGLDPIAERDRERVTGHKRRTSSITFDEAAKLCHAARATEFRSLKHSDDWISSLTMHASPAIGALPVDQIGLPQVMKVLEPKWAEKTETATRVRQRIEKVLSWAAVSGYRPKEMGNPAQWKGVLEHVLAKPSKVRKVTHHPVDAVPHGFRSSFKDWARSSTAFPDEVSELALAHVSTDATRAAYARDELLPKRQKLMEAWAKYCATVHAKGNVTPIKSAAA